MLPRQRAPSLAKTALSGGEGGAAGQGLRKDGTTAKGSIAYGVVGNIPTLARADTDPQAPRRPQSFLYLEYHAGFTISALTILDFRDRMSMRIHFSPQSRPAAAAILVAPG